MYASPLQAVDGAVPRLEDMQKQLQSRIPQSLADRLLAGAKQVQGEYRLVTVIFANMSGSSGIARELCLHPENGSTLKAYLLMLFIATPTA